jgi:hypothetical protein
MNWLKGAAFIIVAMGIAWPSWVLAQGQDQTAQPTQGSQTDIKMGCERRFNLLDKNGDGQVTLEEFSASRDARGRRGERHFQQRDLDGNGVLTKEEFCAGKAIRKGAGEMPEPTQPRAPAATEPQGKGTIQ